MCKLIGAAICAFILALFCMPLAAQNNPVPFLNNPTVPAATVPGGPAFTLRVNGAGFVNGATVLWNGSARTTTFVSGTELTATILSSDIETVNLASVTVSNPAPGGGVSNPALFSVATPATSVAFSNSIVQSGTMMWVDEPGGLVAGSNPADGTPILAYSNEVCPFLAFCTEDNGTIVKLGEHGLVNGDLRIPPETFVIGDFNADGVLDFVDMSQDCQFGGVMSPCTVVALGGPPFPVANPYSLPSGASTSLVPVAGDFNRDGHLDVVIGGQSAVYFIPGNGDGTLGTAISSSTESSIEGGLVAGDFNGDGILDLAVTNPLLNSVSILTGNGDGTFKAAVDYPTGANPGAIATSDFDGDGKLDLAVLDGSGATVSILLGNGDGTFTPHVEYPAGFSANSLTLGDYNGDGIPDIAVSDPQCSNGVCSASGSVNVLLGNGDGTFQTQLDFATGADPTVLVTTGLVSDLLPALGRVGIAVVSYSGDTVSILSPVASQSGGNPVPALTSISPTNGVAGSSFMLTVNGSNFISSSTVSIGGLIEPTTFVSASQLTAAIPGIAIASAGPVTVLVSTPAPGGGISAAVSFIVLLDPPAITSIVPSSVIVGSPGFTLTVNGVNFVNGSTVNIGGASRSATFVSSTQITTSILSSDVASQGTISISVTNPVGISSSSGGTSTSVPLAVLPISSQPTVGVISPASVTAGGQSFILTINGAGFERSSVVTFGSMTVSSVYQSPTGLQATIPAPAIAVAGTQLVTVTNPGSSPSQVVSFAVNNPFPIEALLSPFGVAAGSSALTLDVGGNNFNASSEVLVNGAIRMTTFVSAILLQTTLSTTDLATGGTLNVSVNNPSPGGGTAPPLPFAVADFTVTSPTPPATVGAGQTAVFNFTVAPSNGAFANPITFTVTALPVGATTSFSPSATITPGAVSQTVSLSIATTAHTSSFAPNFPLGKRPVFLMLGLAGMAFGLVILVMRSSMRGLQRLAPQFIFALLLVVSAGLTACSGGGSSPLQSNPTTGTPAGSYTIVVTATSGGASHSASVTLIVQ